MNRFISISISTCLSPSGGFYQVALDEEGRAWERERSWKPSQEGWSGAWVWGRWAEVERLPELQSPPAAHSFEVPK